MNKLFIYGYVVCMFLTPIGILRIFDVGLGFSTLLFLFQLFVCAFVGGFHTFNRLKAWEAYLKRAKMVENGELSPKDILDGLNANEEPVAAEEGGVQKIDRAKLKAAFMDVFADVKQKAQSETAQRLR